MPRHEQISPEEDLASFPGGAPTTAGGPPPVTAGGPPPVTAGGPPPVPVGGPPPVPVGAVSAPVAPTSGVGPAPPGSDPAASATEGGPVIPEPTRTNNGGRLAPVQRPMPTFKDPPTPPAVAPVNSVLAAVISFVLPGAGQIYAGQTMKGVVLLLVAFFTCMGGGIFNVLAAIDAYLIAERRARGETVGDWQIF